MKRIEVYREAGGIVAATYVDGRPDPETVRLFGTHILPTPFKWDVTAACAAIAERNPDAVVVAGAV